MNGLTKVRLGAFLLALTIPVLAGRAWGVNDSVRVETRGPAAGASSVTVGIYLTNPDSSLRNIVIPLIIRKVSGNAFVKKVRLIRNPAGRLASVLTGINLKQGFPSTGLVDTACFTGSPRQYSQGFLTSGLWNDSASVSDAPVGILISIGTLLPSDPVLAPGSDGNTPSFQLVIDVSDSLGQFEIDTTCVRSKNHLVFVTPAGVTLGYLPTFVKGKITVTPTAVQYLGGDGIPHDYSLDQNYPNPFNASTVIRFNTKHDGNVRLDVFNILGQRVKTLVDEFRHFGPQAADWDGTDNNGLTVPTGLYFYRLTTSDYSEVKKMLLLK